MPPRPSPYGTATARRGGRMGHAALPWRAD